VHCGKAYGRRATTTETVRWDTPSLSYERRDAQGRVTIGYVQNGDLAPAPPYRGNGIVLKENFAYVSGKDGRATMGRHVWDGESWTGGYEPFCTMRCALDYARTAYQEYVSRRRRVS
jgi:hypothetical protein